MLTSANTTGFAFMTEDESGQVWPISLLAVAEFEFVARPTAGCFLAGGYASKAGWLTAKITTVKHGRNEESIQVMMDSQNSAACEKGF